MAKKRKTVREVVDTIRKGLAIGGKTNNTDEDDIRFGAVPKDESNPTNKSNVDVKAATNNENPIVGEPTPEPNPSPAPTEPTPGPTTPEPTEPTPEPTEPIDPPASTPEPTPFDAQAQIEGASQVPDKPTAVMAGEGVREGKTTEFKDVDDSVATTTEPVAEEQVTTATKAADVTKAEMGTETIDAIKAEQPSEVKAAEGEITKEIKDTDVDRVDEFAGTKVQIEEGAIAKVVQGTLSPEAKARVATNAGTTLSKVTRAKKQLRRAGVSEDVIDELGNDPEALEDRLTDFTEAERGVIEGLPEEALVSNQLDSLLSGMENGEIPMWAKPAVASVEAMLAERGMSVSTVGRDALFNAIIQSSIPLAQSNAQAIQASVAQQKTIEAQESEANAQRQQQVALQRADVTFKMDMANMAAEQQTELSNSKFLQTVSMVNANNSQQATVQNAVLMSQANIAEASLNGQAQIQNAKNFLTMDMSNLNNEQQGYMLEAQQEQQRILSDQAAANAAERFNATSENQINQFMAGLNVEVEKYNNTQANTMETFNATQKNSAEARRAGREADVNKFDAQLLTQVDQYNKTMDYNMNAWMANNAAAVEAGDLQYLRATNTANTAVQNQINMQTFMSAYGLTSQTLAFLGQQLRDESDFIFRGIQSEEDRKAQILATALANEGKSGELYDDYLSGFLGSIGNSYGNATYAGADDGLFGGNANAGNIQV